MKKVILKILHLIKHFWIETEYSRTCGVCGEKQIAVSYCDHTPRDKQYCRFYCVRWVAEINKKMKMKDNQSAWIYEDELPEDYPYNEMFEFSIVDGVRMFPVIPDGYQLILDEKQRTKEGDLMWCSFHLQWENITDFARVLGYNAVIRSQVNLSHIVTGADGYKYDLNKMDDLPM